MDITLTLLTCMMFMTLVAVISYMKTKGEVNTQDGYFLAGRGLTGTFIAGSMILTNLSAEQLIGLNGSAFGYNLSAMAWEVTAGISTIIMALIFLPRYLAGAFSTLPEFLRDRFDDSVRRMTVVLFMVGYSLVTIPSVLYSGSIAVLRLFDVPGLFNISYEAALVFTIVVVGTVGALYAIFGGLKAVAVSDTINGIGLLIVGLLVPVLGLIALGDGSFSVGLSTIATTETEKLNAIGGADDPVPFGTIFTGMILANLFYWGTNQYVIQRTLGAKNLVEGQKGVLFSGYFKVLVPFMMMLPGVIAYHLYQDEHLQTIDLAYPHLVKDVLPQYLSGFFLAVLLGAVFSSFNSLLNSAATLFCLDVYKPLKKSPVSDDQLIRVAKITSLIIAVLSFITAPLLMFAPEGLWQIIRIFTGFYNIPVITIVLVGLFTKRVPALAAKVAILFHIVAYALLKFVWDVDINFIHIYAILFAIELTIMLVIGRLYPMATPWHFTPKAAVNMTPWRYAIPSAIVLVGLITTLYIVFSPVGFVGGLSDAFAPALIAVWVSCFFAIGLSMKWWNKRYSQRLKRLVNVPS
ncbi:solute:sodium symporter family transporter [Aestuariibacter sp. A3R04]|uniref:solute:sodium symporter family transporter n=1 Tax=Aestuariibacter sp. A3R04 TaxID=2841571 RepID=UPI001C0990D8|nr:solute:sodium symporter family transporter [Aestuariibacter sp. A3R04]MBU3021190.1 solute:sodium symporter family transporter [Aestuariibacter sp. A3R04]